MPRGIRKRKDTGPPPAICQVTTLAEADELRRQITERQKVLLLDTIRQASADIAFAHELDQLAKETYDLAAERLADMGVDVEAELERPDAPAGPKRGTAPPPAAPEPKPATSEPTPGNNGRPTTTRDWVRSVLAEADEPMMPGEILETMLARGFDLPEAVDKLTMAKKVGMAMYACADFVSQGRGVGYTLTTAAS